MAEIKSTLDLVLEKTRHLTLSEEEKRQQKNEEARGRLAGLLQRYQDAMLDTGKMGEELDRLVNAEDGLDESTVGHEIMGCIELGDENERWLMLLQSRYRVEPAGVRSVEDEFHRALEAAADGRKKEIGTELQQLRKISGSAVVPNLNADPVWNGILQSIAAEYNKKLSVALMKLDESIS